MGKKFKKVLAIICTISLLTFLFIPANAYIVFECELSGGVGNSGKNTRYYWLDSSATPYTSSINAAMYSWNHTAKTPGVTTPIWFQPVASKSYSVMDIYNEKILNTTVHGSTSYFATSYDYNSKTNPNLTDWIWCKVVFDASKFTGNNLTANSGHTLQSTVAHEMGHVFGLADNDLRNAIMTPIYYRGTGVQGPSADDCYGVNWIYVEGRA